MKPKTKKFTAKELFKATWPTDKWPYIADLEPWKRLARYINRKMK